MLIDELESDLRAALAQRAAEVPAAAAALGNTGAAMAADIEEGAECTVSAPRQQDRESGVVMGHPVAGVRQQGRQPDRERTLAKEQLALSLGLFLAGVIGDRVAIDPVGHRGRTLIEMGEQFPRLGDLILAAQLTSSTLRSAARWHCPPGDAISSRQ